MRNGIVAYSALFTFFWGFSFGVFLPPADRLPVAGFLLALLILGAVAILSGVL